MRRERPIEKIAPTFAIVVSMPAKTLLMFLTTMRQGTAVSTR